MGFAHITTTYNTDTNFSHSRSASNFNLQPVAKSVSSESTKRQYAKRTPS